VGSLTLTLLKKIATESAGEVIFKISQHLMNFTSNCVTTFESIPL